MKRILVLISLALLLGSVSLQAAPVSLNQAMDVAKKIFAAQPATKAGTGALKLVWDGEDVATKAAQPAFYVIARDGGGFVIVAGDDNAKPLLAFSKNSPFVVEGMPENVKWWMEQIKNYVRDTKYQTNDVKTQWNQLVGTKADLSPVNIIYESLTAPWSQTGPANEYDLIPTVTDQGKSIAGCLPLAMAEILTWHGWPNTGVGSSAAYSYTSGNNKQVNVASYNLSSLSIDVNEWNALRALDTYDKFTNCSGSTRSKLSQLVYACGVILGAEYNDGIHGGTSASSNKVIAAFGDHMRYNKAANLASKNEYYTNEWDNMLKAEIAKRPVLYCGIASAGGGNDSGHAYVMDGFGTFLYNSVEYDVFHINFGWGGNCNGYYQSFYQETETTEHYTYNSNFQALFDFYPVSGDESSYINFTYYETTPPTPGLKYVDPFAVGSYFRIQYALSNNGGTYNGQLQAKLIKKDETVRTTCTIYINSEYGWTDEISDFVTGSKCSQLRILVPEGTLIEFGDRIVLEYSTSTNSETTEFKRIKGRNDGKVIYELPVMPTAFIRTEDSYEVNDTFKFELLNYDSVYAGTTWTITDPDGVKSSNLPQITREFKLTKAGTYKIEAAIAPYENEATVENVVAYITVN